MSRSWRRCTAAAAAPSARSAAAKTPAWRTSLGRDCYQPGLARPGPRRRRPVGLDGGFCLRGELAHAEPKRLRFAPLHAAGLIVRSARRLTMRIAAGWPWADDLVNAFGRLPGWSLVT